MGRFERKLNFFQFFAEIFDHVVSGASFLGPFLQSTSGKFNLGSDKKKMVTLLLGIPELNRVSLHFGRFSRQLAT